MSLCDCVVVFVCASSCVDGRCNDLLFAVFVWCFDFVCLRVVVSCMIDAPCVSMRYDSCCCCVALFGLYDDVFDLRCIGLCAARCAL